MGTVLVHMDVGDRIVAGNQWFHGYRSVLPASRRTAVLEILLAAVPALKVPVERLRLGGLGFGLLVRELVSDGFQLFGFLRSGPRRV